MIDQPVAAAGRHAVKRAAAGWPVRRWSLTLGAGAGAAARNRSCRPVSTIRRRRPTPAPAPRAAPAAAPARRSGTRAGASSSRSVQPCPAAAPAIAVRDARRCRRSPVARRTREDGRRRARRAVRPQAQIRHSARRAPGARASRRASARGRGRLRRRFAGRAARLAGPRRARRHQGAAGFALGPYPAAPRAGQPARCAAGHGPGRIRRPARRAAQPHGRRRASRARWCRTSIRPNYNRGARPMPRSTPISRPATSSACARWRGSRAACATDARMADGAGDLRRLRAARRARPSAISTARCRAAPRRGSMCCSRSATPERRARAAGRSTSNGTASTN